MTMWSAFVRAGGCTLALLGCLIGGAWMVGVAIAQEPPALEEVIVTATRREQLEREVPFSLSTLHGERFGNLFESGEDIRALAVRVPSLYAESSNGRVAPRFYIRGLGNTDFDLAASQPVSIVVDEVVQENVILKSFPLFDIERVEVLRGPQGTLFGRNTPAGIVKFETVKPSQETDGYIHVTGGTLGTFITEGAFGGGISETLSARVSMRYQLRDEWIDNDFTGQSDELGEIEEFAYRLQLLYEGEPLNALVNFHARDLEGTSSLFRANIIGPGSNSLNSNFDRDTVFFDEGRGNPQEYDSLGGSLRLEYTFPNDMMLTSITAYERTDGFSLGDIDGGNCTFVPVFDCGPGFIPFPSVTQDGIEELDQFTQELRLSSSAEGPLTWQAGVFYFDSDFEIQTMPFFIPPTRVRHENDAWAVFGQASYELTDRLTVTGGLRYTDDEKDFDSSGEPVPSGPVSVDDDEISWDVAANLYLTDELNIFGRVARGFRAPTIQGRDVAFFGVPSIADSETILSYEVGFKSAFLSNRVRLDGTVFYYEIEDQQLTAIGGAANLVQLVNADEGTALGVELETQVLLLDNLLITAGYSYVDTELEDNALRVAPCGSGQCTVVDRLDADGFALVDGNAFPQAPEYTAGITARYSWPFLDGELFVSSEWAWQGETHFFLYETKEFFSDDTYEGSVRFGWTGDRYEVAVFGRNITDEENLKGGIDFNNLTGFVNEPRIWGVSVGARF